MAHGSIGYFRHLQIGDRHQGAVLVTNQIGIPLEFKYTEPVSATRLHRILYGPSLERYLRETVIRDRLGREVKSDPDFFITSYEEKEYLGAMAGKEMMAVQRYAVPPGEPVPAYSRVRDTEVIVCFEEGPSLRVAFSIADDQIQRGMVEWLARMGRTMDVLEPMERVVQALRMLQEERKG